MNLICLGVLKVATMASTLRSSRTQAARAKNPGHLRSPVVSCRPGIRSRSRFHQQVASETQPCAIRKKCWRSEEHTSELQSRGHLVCRLLLEKKKKETKYQRKQQTRVQRGQR